jgi:hypothetical protein
MLGCLLFYKSLPLQVTEGVWLVLLATLKGQVGVVVLQVVSLSEKAANSSHL